MDFAQKFHDLEGATPGELNRNFNKFRQEISKLPQIELHTVLDKIIANNLQMQLLHLQLLLEHGSYQQLERILFQGNRFLNRKLTNSLRFIKYFDKIPPKEFCERICPEISYVTRIRIINKLPKVIDDTNIGQAYFQAVNERYGLRLALKLITACGEAFILKAIDEYKIKFTYRQMIDMHTKYPNFVLIYFNDARKLIDNKKIAQYLAIKDIDTFCKLIKYGLPLLGKKASLNFVKHYKANILENPDLYKHAIKASAVNSVFTFEESIEFLQKLLPDDCNASYDESKYLDAMPRKIRGTIIFSAFRNHFGIEFDDNFVNEQLLGLITPEDRKRFKLNEKYLEFMSPKEAIPLIKNKMSFARNVAAKTTLVEKLLKVCKHNRDHSALVDVLEYVCAHFKNEMMQFWHKFLSALNDLFKLENLSAKHWEYINDILMIFEVNYDYHSIVQEVGGRKIHYKYLNGLDYTEDILKLLKGHYDFCVSDITIPNAQRNCLLKAGEYLDELDKETKSITVHSFFDSLINYNTMKNSDPISVLQYKELLIIYFEEFIKYKYKSSISLKHIMKIVPANSDEEVVKSIVIKYYYQACPYQDVIINMWLVKNLPSVVAENAETYFCTDKFELPPEFYYEASKIPIVANKFHEVAKNIVNSNDSEVTSVAIALKYLAFDGSFLQFVAKYRPSEDCKIDIHNEDIGNKVVIQSSLLNAVRNIVISSTCISEILNYCKGDYFVYAINALYIVMYNIPEKLIYEPIDVLMNGNISVKKQAIYLLCNLSISQHISTVLRRLGDGEQNKMLGKFLFKRTINILYDYPDLFDLLENQLLLLNKNDNESFKTMLELDKIPDQYQNQYVILIWKHVIAQQLQFHILLHLETDIWTRLDRDTCETILITTLFKKKNFINMTELVYEYVLHGGDLKIIYAIPEAKECQMYTLLKGIVESIANDKGRKDLRLQLATKLLHGLDSDIVVRDKFPLQIRLEACIFLFDIEGNVVTQMASCMADQLDVAVEKYGFAIVDYFQKFAEGFLQTIISRCVNDSKDKHRKIALSMLEAAEKMAEGSNKTQSKLLALHILPKNYTKDETFNKRRKLVLEHILKDCDLAVNVYIANMFYTEDF